jgi:glycosyltransferase involved in cell wall biosynthesis
MSAPPAAVRVAVTLEQCWHRVPGGTAAAAVETLRALLIEPPAAALELVGVSGRHRRPPIAAWQPPIATAQLPLAGPALYEAWHRWRRPRVERATGPVDVIWATGVAMPPPTVPIVLTVHDLAFLRDPSHFTKHGSRFFEAALRLARTDAALVLCSSEATKADCVAAGLPADRLRVVPLGVRPSPFAAQPAVDVAAAVGAVRRRFGIERPYVLTLGTVEPRKNLRGVLAAFAELHAGGDQPDLDLVVVGPEGWNEDLDGAVPERLRQRVHRTGFVAELDKAALLRGAAVLAYPSLWEGFGLPVLEAMAEGTPVVTSAGTATAEAAGDAALLVDPLDPADIAAGLARAIGDAQVAGELRTAGFARAAELTWDRTAALVRQALLDAAATA